MELGAENCWGLLSSLPAHGRDIRLSPVALGGVESEV